MKEQLIPNFMKIALYVNNFCKFNNSFSKDGKNKLRISKEIKNVTVKS